MQRSYLKRIHVAPTTTDITTTLFCLIISKANPTLIPYNCYNCNEIGIFFYWGESFCCRGEDNTTKMSWLFHQPKLLWLVYYTLTKSGVMWCCCACLNCYKDPYYYKPVKMRFFLCGSLMIPGSCSSHTMKLSEMIC